MFIMLLDIKSTNVCLTLTIAIDTGDEIPRTPISLTFPISR
ncbi:MAG: hypothetical protein JWR38_2797 [Mucilaginibacter sp.]|nr:hypothetical protein [Mucilaginibacter sp.]